MPTGPPVAGPVLARPGAAASIVRTFADPAVPVAVWRRTVDPVLAAALAAVARDLPAVDCTLHRAAVGAGCLPEVVRALPGAEGLCADVEALAACFADATVSTRLRFVFGPVLDDKCKRFHVDFVRVRMVVTYLGPGTQWLEGEAAQRHGPRGAVAGSCGHGVPADEIRCAQAGDVVWMRGVYGGGAPAVHRSPPLGESGQARVVWTLSTAD